MNVHKWEGEHEVCFSVKNRNWNEKEKENVSSHTIDSECDHNI